MEQSLGYKLTSSSTQDVQRYYSDLSPVPQSIHDQTRKELEKHLRAKRRADTADFLGRVLPPLGAVQAGTCWPLGFRCNLTYF